MLRKPVKYLLQPIAFIHHLNLREFSNISLTFLTGIYNNPDWLYLYNAFDKFIAVVIVFTNTGFALQA
ncbi:hypothetical protein WM06_14900 [Burkholderia cepacia]|nr:hypothetical protein WK21_24405 [Burkholderia cepacia]KWI51853.1 hypothetical protein WM06_14900 [Burkholderia cepacia]